VEKKDVLTARQSDWALAYTSLKKAVISSGGERSRQKIRDSHRKKGDGVPSLSRVTSGLGRAPAKPALSAHRAQRRPLGGGVFKKKRPPATEHRKNCVELHLLLLKKKLAAGGSGASKRRKILCSSLATSSGSPLRLKGVGTAPRKEKMHRLWVPESRSEVDNGPASGR